MVGLVGILEKVYRDKSTRTIINYVPIPVGRTPVLF